MSALDNTFEEINSAISGVDEFFEFNPNWVNMGDTFFLDLTGQNIGIANIEPTEALDIGGNIKVGGYINQVVSGAGTPFTLYFPNNKDGGFYYDTDNDNVYLCYNHAGELYYNKFSNESFDKLQNTFSEIDAAISGVDSLTTPFVEIDSALAKITSISPSAAEINRVVTGYDSISASPSEIESAVINYNEISSTPVEIEFVVNKYKTILSLAPEIDYAASGVASLSVDFNDIDSGIGFTLGLDYDSTETNSFLALASTSIQSGNNISELNNDTGYITSAPVDSVNGLFGSVVLDADDIDDSLSINKFVTQSGVDKLGFISVTQAVDLDLMELTLSYYSGDMVKSTYDPTNVNADVFSMGNMVESSDAKILTTGERDKLGFISVTQAVDLDAIELANGDMVKSTYDPTNVNGDAFSMSSMVESSDAKILTSGERDKLGFIEAGAQVNVNSDWDSIGGDSEILNKPAFGDITGSNIADFATSTQGDLADSALQSGDNISVLINDTGYLLFGDNVSDLANDALYVSSGDNVSDLANDALYVSSGDNVSDLANDALYRSLNFHTETGSSYNAGTNNETIILADASITDVTINLPAVASSANTEFIIKAIDLTNTITIDGNASEAIDGDTGPISPFNANHDFINVICDGAQWWIISK